MSSQKDYDGTLWRKSPPSDTREVELAGFFGKKPARDQGIFGQSFGLHCGSIHIPASDQLAEAMDYAKVIGAKYVITSRFFCPSALPRLGLKTGLGRHDHKAQSCDSRRLQVDRRAMQSNGGAGPNKRDCSSVITTTISSSSRFRAELDMTSCCVRLTPGSWLRLELDCGWISAAGFNPATYLTKYPDRYRMLHIKDFKLTSKPIVRHVGSREPGTN